MSRRRKVCDRCKGGKCRRCTGRRASGAPCHCKHPKREWEWEYPGLHKKWDREARLAAAVDGEPRSTSVRTVSGGLPGLGKRR